jgi:transposase-like protein
LLLKSSKIGLKEADDYELKLIADLKVRGIQDIFIACIDD